MMIEMSRNGKQKTKKSYSVRGSLMDETQRTSQEISKSQKKAVFQSERLLRIIVSKNPIWLVLLYVGIIVRKRRLRLREPEELSQITH